MTTYYQSGSGVSEYRGREHNRAAVTGRSTQSAGPGSREGLPLTVATVGSLKASGNGYRSQMKGKEENN